MLPVVFITSPFMSSGGIMQDCGELRLRGKVWSQMEINIPKLKSYVGKQHME